MADTIKYLDYEPRPAFSSPVAAAYHERCIALGATVTGAEHAYGSHPLQRLLVFPAANPTGEVMLALHGGRFSHGYKEWMAMMAPPLNRRGVTLVSSSYRLVSFDPFPAGLQDCGRALKWIEDHLDSFGGRRDAIFVGGHSAGGHYAALLAVTPEVTGLEGIPRVAGCLPISGIFDFDSTGLPGQLLFPNGTTGEMYAAASPLRARLRGSPAFHITWGSKDLVPVPEQSLRMVEALRQADVDVEMLILEDADHFDASLEAANMDGVWINSAAAFLKRHRA